MTSYQLRAPVPSGGEEVLTADALAFVADLERRFRPGRDALLRARRERRARILDGERPGFLPETAEIRDATWRVAPLPADLRRRTVEITGPVDPKMMINALNSGADVFMADFEDATTPAWDVLVRGQQALVDAVRRTLALDAGDRTYRLADRIATLLVRPRGWHLPEKHLVVDGRPVSASLFDVGLYLFHGGRAAIEEGTGPYLYLPKLQDHLEARLWNDVFVFAQERLGIPHGTVKATVLVEHVLAAFEMDEILYELRDHSAGLNAGRWDYIFSVIKTFRHDPDVVLPDRAQVTMTVPFMRAYTDLQVATCHRRGAPAIGGMAAFIPNRRKPDVTSLALERVAADKRREAGQGYDGTWVAHPDLVEVARAEFRRVLGDRPNQIDRIPEVDVTAADLLDTTVEGGRITEAGLRANVSVGIRYLASWLDGRGAAAIDDLMEDVATAEISRSQVWQWVRHGSRLDDGRTVTAELVRHILDEEVSAVERTAGPVPRLLDARKVFEEVALADDFVEFLTLPAYDLID